MPTGIIDALLPAIDSILSVRDAIGAVIQPVYLVTRTWYTDGTLAVQSSAVGEGVAKDVEAQMLPSPALKSLAMDFRAKEGGVYEQGDMVLQNVSKNSYSRTQLEAGTNADNVEKLIRVGAKLYQVINLKESYVTWDVQIRELTNQTRYP